jgi:DNA polymerase-3 subunit beta
VLKIQVQQSELVRALVAVASVVSNKTTLPILSTILFDAEGDSLTLAATDLDVSVVTRMDGVKVGKAGRIAVPASKFVAFSRTLGPESVDVNSTAEKVTVKSGKARFEESLMAADEFPNLPKIVDDQSFEIASEILCEMIKSTIYAISRDETRPALQGVLWELRPGAFTMVATDGHRLSRVRRAVDLPVKGERQFIASSAGLQQVLRLAEGTETVKVFMGEHQLSFEIGGTTVHTRLVEGIFPAYQQVIPKSNSHRAICDRQTLADRIRRVKISADRVTNQVRFELEEDSLGLSASGTEGSRAEDELKVEYGGEPLVIGFNHNYVEDVLKHMATENVVIALERSDAAAIFLPGENPSAGIDESDDLCLLMPLRLND